MKLAKYAGCLSYLSAVVTTNKSLRFTLENATENMYKKMRHGLEVGLGDVAKAEPVTHEDLVAAVRIGLPQKMVAPLCLAVSCFYFQLRSEGVLEMKGFCSKGADCKCGAHVHLDGKKRDVSLLVSSDKTNWRERKLVRTLKCVCPDDTGVETDLACRVCPYCAVKKIREMPRADDTMS